MMPLKTVGDHRDALSCLFMKRCRGHDTILCSETLWRNSILIPIQMQFAHLFPRIADLLSI